MGSSIGGVVVAVCGGEKQKKEETKSGGKDKKAKGNSPHFVIFCCRSGEWRAKCQWPERPVLIQRVIATVTVTGARGGAEWTRDSLGPLQRKPAEAVMRAAKST